MRSLSSLAALFTISFGWLKWVLEADFLVERGASGVGFESSESEVRCLAWQTDCGKQAMNNKAEQNEVDRVDRGGSWNFCEPWARVGFMSGDEPGSRYNAIGFRLARHRSALSRLADENREVGDEPG